jgi:hypothetical protein
VSRQRIDVLCIALLPPTLTTLSEGRQRFQARIRSVSSHVLRASNIPARLCVPPQLVTTNFQRCRQWWGGWCGWCLALFSTHRVSKKPVDCERAPSTLDCRYESLGCKLSLVPPDSAEFDYIRTFTANTQGRCLARFNVPMAIYQCIKCASGSAANAAMRQCNSANAAMLTHCVCVAMRHCIMRRGFILHAAPYLHPSRRIIFLGVQTDPVRWERRCGTQHPPLGTCAHVHDG